MRGPSTIVADYTITDKALKDRHKGETALIVGGSPSVNEVDLSTLRDCVTIGCNRVLMHPTFRPDYIVLCDRLPYKLEYDRGVFGKWADQIQMLVSTTLFDPAIRCRGHEVLPEPDFPYLPWRVGVCSTPINVETFTRPLCSFATIPGPMLQMAVIMGVKRIGFIGVDLKTPGPQGSIHFYAEGKGEGRSGTGLPQNIDGSIAPSGCLQRFGEARDMLKGRVEILNLSPWEDTPFSEVFGNYPFNRFVEECK